LSLSQSKTSIPTVPAPELRAGIVTKKLIGTYWLNVEGEDVACSISSTLRKRLIYPTADPSSLHHRVQEVKDIEAVDPIAIGDQVRYIPADPMGVIVEVLPRRNKLSRKAAGAKPLEQIIAANIDQIVAVFSAAQPQPKWNLLDRYLVTAEAEGIPFALCITKTDLVKPNDDVYRAGALYESLGYPVHYTSIADYTSITAYTGIEANTGIDAIRELLKDRVSIMIGKSGVGKTSLLNAVQPGLGLRIGEISKKLHKGKHTTTHLEMIPLEMGGAIIDTPGMREFDLWNPEGDDPALYFVEMRDYVGTCKFGLDCTHTREPGCMITAAVKRGEISQRRYESYLKLAE
jgi:ribosome biogenesis GTPase